MRVTFNFHYSIPPGMQSDLNINSQLHFSDRSLPACGHMVQLDCFLVVAAMDTYTYMHVYMYTHKKKRI